jgi:negative regulator of replication initiation
LLTPISRSKEEFELRINVSLDVKSFMNVQSIVSKHRMILKEDKGSLLIYGSETKPNGMEVTA